MIKLDRGGLAAPHPRWRNSVTKAFSDKGGDLANFEAAALAFERRSLASRKAPKGGFLSQATHHLPSHGHLPLKGRPPNTEPFWPPRWRQWSQIKKKLLAISLNKCAYCESLSGADQHGQVEHFRPKSIFPTRAYDWDNYLYSCELCNHTKDNKWPDTGPYPRPDDPAFDPDWFAFDAAGGMSGTAGHAQSQDMVDDFGLDREGLRAARSTMVEEVSQRLEELLDDLEADGIPRLRQRRYAARELVGDALPYSRAINAAVRRVWAAKGDGSPL